MKGNAVYTAKEKAYLDIDEQVKSLITREVITNYIVYESDYGMIITVLR